MANFRISFDVDAGWVVFTPYANDLIWSNENDINPAIDRVMLAGSVKFVGSEYTTIKNFKDAGNKYIPILVEQDDSGWNTIFEGNADLFSPWDENRKTITLNKFNNDDNYDNLLSNYDIKYNLTELSVTSNVIVTPSVLSTTIDAFLVPGTGLSPANYILAYDINGFNFSPVPDPRWAYFLFRSTNPDGSHNFETMSFDYNVGAFDFVEIKMLIGTTFFGSKWVKLPGVIGATQSIINVVSNTAYRFPSLINTLLTLANTSLTFTEATAVTYIGQFDSTPTQYSFFDYTKYHISETSEVASIGTKNSEISLKDCLDIMADAFDLHWYLDGTALKFKHISELGTSGILDLQTLTANLKRLEYIEANNIPDIEKFITNDAEGTFSDPSGGFDPWGIFQIYYRASNNILSNNITREHKINISTNFVALMTGLGTTDKNKFALIETTDDSSVPRVIYGSNPNFNIRLASANLFGHLNKWRFDDSASLATRLKLGLVSLTEIESRPLLKIPTVNYHVDLLTSYDMDKAITTSAGSGKTKSIRQKLNTDYAELEIEI